LQEGRQRDVAGQREQRDRQNERAGERSARCRDASPKSTETQR
jgi:hypothetical protein